MNEELLIPIVEEYGDECWLYASDIPHNHRMYRAADHLTRLPGLSDDSKRKLLAENTARFYGFDL